MRIIVTCGPGHEPIDRVRCITNLSTGQLGSLLADRFCEAGHEVLCLLGQGALHAPVQPGVRTVRFETNEHLLELLLAKSERERVGAVFHAAALPDFRVLRVLDSRGRPVATGKISSRAGELHLVLQPSLKIVSKLRDLFPEAQLVGWKYETDGTREDALAQGRRLMEANRLDACVVNGPACGLSFVFCPGAGRPESLRDRARLVSHLVDWLATAHND